MIDAHCPNCGIELAECAYCGDACLFDGAVKQQLCEDCREGDEKDEEE